MTKINIIEKCGAIVGFEVSGHANYACSGSDIVCAAVSTITINTINSLKEIACVDVDIEEKSGYVKFEIHETTAIATVILQSALLGYKSIAEEYRYYVQVRG